MVEFEKNLTTEDIKVNTGSGTVNGNVIIFLAKKSIPDLVKEFVNLLETRPSNEFCKCTWIAHPDDVDVPENCCRVCHAFKDDQLHTNENFSEYHIYEGRRLRPGEYDPQCPVHTKDGLILGFLEWAVKDKSNDNEPRH